MPLLAARRAQISPSDRHRLPAHGHGRGPGRLAPEPLAGAAVGPCPEQQWHLDRVRGAQLRARTRMVNPVAVDPPPGGRAGIRPPRERPGDDRVGGERDQVTVVSPSRTSCGSSPGHRWATMPGTRSGGGAGRHGESKKNVPSSAVWPIRTSTPGRMPGSSQRRHAGSRPRRASGARPARAAVLRAVEQILVQGHDSRRRERAQLGGIGRASRPSAPPPRPAGSHRRAAATAGSRG